MSSKVDTPPTSLRNAATFTLVLSFILTSFATLARLYTKFRLTRNAKIEDYFGLLSYLLFLANLGLVISIDKSKADAVYIAYLSVIEATLYFPTIFFVKASILFQYVTIFVAHRWTFFHCAVHFLIWLNAIYYTFLIFWYTFECNPREKQWNPSIPGHCFSGDKVGISVASINIFSDFSILLLPLPTILQLQMPSAKKIKYLAVFSCGLFACITSIMRLYYAIDIRKIPRGQPGHQISLDKEGLWGFAEIAIGILISCTPSLPRFLKHIFATANTTQHTPLKRAFQTLTPTLRPSSWRSLLFLHWRSRDRSSSAYQDQGDKEGVGGSSSGDGSGLGLGPELEKDAVPRIEALNMTRAELDIDF